MEYSADTIIRNMEKAMYDLILERITDDENVEDCYLVNDIENGKLQIMYMEQAYDNDTGKFRGVPLLNLMEKIAEHSSGAEIWMPDEKAIRNHAEKHRHQIEEFLARL